MTSSSTNSKPFSSKCHLPPRLTFDLYTSNNTRRYPPPLYCIPVHGALIPHYWMTFGDLRHLHRHPNPLYPSNSIQSIQPTANCFHSLMPMSHHSNCLRHIHHSTIHCHTVITYTAVRPSVSDRFKVHGKAIPLTHRHCACSFYTPRSQPCRRHRIASPEPSSADPEGTQIVLFVCNCNDTFNLPHQSKYLATFNSYLMSPSNGLCPPSTRATSQGIEEAPLNFPDDTINERRSRGDSRL